MKKAFLWIGCAVLMGLLGACSNSKQQKQAAVNDSTTQTSVAQKAFPFPDIPAMLTSPEDRMNYLFAHYWDKFDFADTALVNDRDVREQGFVNQLALLSQGAVAQKSINEGINALCTGMEQHEHAREVFMKMIDDYLYNANSPYYNEPLYIVYLKRMLQSKVLDDARKSTFDFKLKLASRNMPDTKATDFVYYLPDGQRRTLAQTPVKNNRLLLMFYDPECPNCHRTLEDMKHDEALAQHVAEGGLTVLAVYTETEQEKWKADVPQMPKGWTVGSDRHVIQEQALYDLKAMPSLYLLDGSKKVLLKDAPYDVIRRYLGWGEMPVQSQTN